MRLFLTLGLLSGVLVLAAAGGDRDQAKGTPRKLPLDAYIEEALSKRNAPNDPGASGSIFETGTSLVDLNRDLRALRVDDVVTILVVEQASSVTSGSVAAERQSKLRSGVDTLFGVRSPASVLPNLAGLESSNSLGGQGSTSRQVSVSTTLSARVTHVLPNGNLALEAVKRIGINGEQQEVRVRGVIRPTDLGRQNTVTSDRLAMLEVTVNGKGVVADAIRKPHILVNLLTKILPF